MGKAVTVTWLVTRSIAWAAFQPEISRPGSSEFRAVLVCQRRR